MDRAMRRNLWLLYVLRALRSALISIPVIVPFWQANGLSQMQIFLLQAGFAATAVVLEVPSGYFADRYGCKTSLVLGAVLSVLGFVVYAASTGFYAMLAAECVLGIGASFISGADSALAYDSLLSLGRQDTYRRFEARGSSYSGLAEGAASVLGGLIAVYSLRGTITAQIIVYAPLIPLALMLTEPQRHGVRMSDRNILADVVRTTRYALHGHAEIKWLIAYASVASTLTYTMVWLTQPYYQLVGVPIGWFGVLWAIQLLALAGFAPFADRYEKALGRRRALVSFLLLGVAAYTVLGAFKTIWVLPVVLVFYFIRAMHAPILQDYVNRLVESNIRATVLSVKSLAQRLLYVGLGPFIGWIMDLYTLPIALLVSAVIYAGLGLLVIAMMHRTRIL
jgi:MFS family permease